MKLDMSICGPVVPYSGLSLHRTNVDVGYAPHIPHEQAPLYMQVTLAETKKKAFITCT